MLADILVPSKEVRVGEQSFSVRGVTFGDIAALIAAGDRADIEEAVAAIADANASAEAGDASMAVNQVLGQLLMQLPGLAAKVIAVCADEPENWGKALTLPAPVQLDALVKIGTLTFTGDDALKNFVAGLKQVLTTLTTAAGSVTNQPGLIGTKD